MTKEQIQQKLIELGPWHLDIQLPNGLSTGKINSLKNYQLTNEINIVDPTKLTAVFNFLYNNSGIKGKTLLDVGCNAGGYCFLASELGAKFSYGFDARDHWINQANFIKKIKNISEDKIQFHTHHINEITNLNQRFDVTLFKGVFYHLPNPILAIEQLSAITNDFMIIDSGCRLDIPEDCMIPKFENPNHVMSGVDGLSWYPGGPAVIERICKHYGFPFSKIVFFRKKKYEDDKRSSSVKRIGRFRMIVARKEEDLTGKITNE